jgi:hypothetical protein
VRNKRTKQRFRRAICAQNCLQGAESASSDSIRTLAYMARFVHDQANRCLVGAMGPASRGSRSPTHSLTTPQTKTGGAPTLWVGGPGTERCSGASFAPYEQNQIEGCGFPLIRQKHANEWGTVHLRFIQGVTRCAGHAAQNDGQFCVAYFRLRTLEKKNGWTLIAGLSKGGSPDY